MLSTVVGIWQKCWFEGHAADFLLKKSGLSFTAVTQRATSQRLYWENTETCSVFPEEVIIPDDEVGAADGLAFPRDFGGSTVDPAPRQIHALESQHHFHLEAVI